jgi:hypothetical protein
MPTLPRGRCDRNTSPGRTFSTLGVNAFGGRLFMAAEDAPAAAPAVVISHHVWEGTYGADPSILGATLFVEGHPFTVIGITPPDSLAKRCAAIRLICSFPCSRNR